MDTVCTALCQAIRDFATITCPRYATKELPKEARARLARQTDQENRGKSRTRRKAAGVKTKRFNMETFKLHCIPDYVPMIRKYGTTDSYSTQTVSPPSYPLTRLVLINWFKQSELAHRLSKMWYRTSNRNRNFVSQITAKESRTRFYTAMLEEINKGAPDPVTAPEPDLEDGDTPSDPGERYRIPKAATVRDLTGWLAENQGDPALRVSVNLCLLLADTDVRAGFSNSPYRSPIFAHQRATVRWGRALVLKPGTRQYHYRKKPNVRSSVAEARS